MLKTIIKAAKTYLSGRFDLFRKGQPLLERQQRIAFVLYTAAVVSGLLANLFGLTGPQSVPVLLQNAVFLSVALSLTAACLCRRLSLPRTFCLMVVASQLFTCSEIIICSFSTSDYMLLVIIGNMFLLVGNLLFALVAYLERTVYILAATSVATYCASAWITGEATLLNFLVLIVLLFTAVAVLGNLLMRNLNRFKEENNELKKEEREILDVLRLKRDEVRAYIRLAKSRNEVIETERLLRLFGEESRNNVIQSVSEAVTARKMEQTRLSSVFPELSPSEIDICRLVILGKTLKETCALLHKAESNVTCQRTNIRRKLGLKPGDDLKEALMSRFDNAGNG